MRSNDCTKFNTEICRKDHAEVFLRWHMTCSDCLIYLEDTQMNFSRANYFFLFTVWMLSTSFQAQSEPASAVPQVVKAASVDVYAALPGVSAAHLSPDGTLLALIAPVKGRNALVVRNLSDNKSQVITTGDFEPKWIIWKTNRRLLVGMVFYSLRNPLNPTVDTRLIAIDADGSNGLNLINPDLYSTYIPQTQDTIVSLLPNDENHILIELPAIARELHNSLSGVSQIGSLDSKIKYPEVVRVDVNTGRLETIAHQHGNVVKWHADAAGNVRLGLELDGRTKDFQVRSLSNNSWYTIQPHEVNSWRIFNPVAFVEGNPNRIYVQSNHQNGAVALYEFDVPTNSFIRTVADNPRGGVDPIERDGHLIGYRLFSNISPVYLDATYAREAKVINKALADSSNDIVDLSTDGKRVLVHVTKGNEPSAFWLLDRSTGRPVLSPVVETYPVLEPSQIAPTRLVSYKARDGLDIPALLTLPPGYFFGSGKQISFVVLPHGGPTAHDIPGFDYQVQFLASRGYGVFQPQFRGSTGYGAAFEVAGQKQWGLAMQDDVTDGTHWLVNQKLADPTRIAIVGSSYGGYAALMGAVKEPELYRCAVAIAPVTDLELLIERYNNFLFSDINVPRIGTDSAKLVKNSPVQNVERIRIPLLLVHGRKDYTVPVAQTEVMDKALRKAGKPAEVLYLEEADHYLSRGRDRLDTLKAVEKFLSSNLAEH